MKTAGAAGSSVAGEQLGQSTKRCREPSPDASMYDTNVSMVDMYGAPILQPVSLGSYMSEEEEDVHDRTKRRQRKGKGKAIRSPSPAAPCR